MGLNGMNSKKVQQILTVTLIEQGMTKRTNKNLDGPNQTHKEDCTRYVIHNNSLCM